MQERTSAVSEDDEVEADEHDNDSEGEAARRAQQESQEWAATVVDAQAEASLSRNASHANLCPAAPAPGAPPPPGGECSVCMDQTNTHVLVPCGHKCVCSDCAELVRLQGACPICRTAIVWVCEVFE